MLLVFEQKDETLPPLSDAVCTALQLANHWQDAALDYARGRIYVPRGAAAASRRHGLGLQHAGRVSEGWRGLMGELIGRTRELFERGKPICERVGRELRFEMRLTWLGGMSILDRIEAVGGDVFRKRPKHGTLDKAALALRAWRWRSA